MTIAMGVYRKLQKCRVELQAMEIRKSGYNKFAGYDYFELGDFLKPINDLFYKHNLFSCVSFTREMAILSITDCEEGSTVTFTSPMETASLKGCHPIQNLGAVETYQRRYLYITALEIVEHDALDSSQPLKETKAITKPITPTSGAGEGLTKEQKSLVSEVASQMMDWLEQGSPEDAVLTKENAALDADENVYLWTFFDSKQRSAMKKAHEEMKSKIVEQEV
jgi:hypothetical protein